MAEGGETTATRGVIECTRHVHMQQSFSVCAILSIRRAIDASVAIRKSRGFVIDLFVSKPQKVPLTWFADLRRSRLERCDGVSLAIEGDGHVSLFLRLLEHVWICEAM